MNRFPVSFKAVFTILLTLLLVVVGVVNVRDRVRYIEPYDGIVWAESESGLVAEAVAKGTPGAAAGVQTGDTLEALNGLPIADSRDYYSQLDGLKPGYRASYRISRNGESRNLALEIGERRLFGAKDALRALLALLHLGVGLFVAYRAGRQPRAYHFFLICLAAFVVYLYSFTPVLGTIDLVVYWISIAAFLLLPTLFVHFCQRFPADLPEWRARSPLLYAPATLLAMLHLLWVTGHLARFGLPRTVGSSMILDRVHIVYFSLGFLAGGIILLRRRLTAGDWTTRQQMKWISCGTLLGILPFSLIYVLPWLFGAGDSFLMWSSMLFLGFIPLSFAYAIVRYRLIDVEILMRRGAAYLGASSLLLALYLFFVLVLGRALQWAAPEADFVIICTAALAIALLFAPLRNALQLRLDRLFYKEQFEDRAGLLDFARTLGSEIGLGRLSRSILERVQKSFLVDRAALYLHDPKTPGSHQLACAAGFTAGCGLQQIGDEALGEAAGPDADNHPRSAPPVFAAEGFRFLQDLLLRGRRIGLIALGAPPAGRHFSSEDRDLLAALAGYAAIALENASLYRSVEAKALELERLRSYTENIIESINIAVLALDLQGNVTSCNRAFERLYHARRQLIRATRAEDLLGPDIVTSVMEVTGRNGWEIKSAGNIYKLYLVNRRDERLIVNLSVIPLKDAAGTAYGSLLVMDDITEKSRMEEQLLQVEKLSSLGLLAAGVAHEVNTPITGISSYTQMLLNQTPDSDHRKPILAKIEKQTFRAAEIVNGLLNFARINGSELKDLDINQLIEESLSLLDHQFRQSRIQVDSSLDRSVPPVYGNAGKLQQVLINLLLNARDAMPAGGWIKIGTKKNDTMVIVDIVDTGAGITEENLKRIYDPFFTTKTTGKGTGLGLAVAYGIIQEHGGRIFVDSAPAKGTHFTLKLPTRRANG